MGRRRSYTGANASKQLALAWVALVAASWTAPAPARACQYITDFEGAAPGHGSVLPTGEVYVALHYLGRPWWEPSAFRVANELDEDVPFTGLLRGDAMLLRFDTSGAGEVFVFGPAWNGENRMLAAYEVSLAATDLGTPTAPQVTVGDTTCSACSEPHSSCCNFPDGDGRYNTTVTFTTAEPGTILGWVDGGGQLAGVFWPGTYQSSPADFTPASMPPAGAPIVAMSAAGVMSPPVSWALDRTGRCDARRSFGLGEGGCVASPDGGPRALWAFFLLGVALLAARRPRPRRR